MGAPEPSAALTADGRGRVLADGMVMPLLGLGVWQVPDGPTCVQAVRAALELGYRHIDTAQAYGNEASVGRALRESGIARDEVFITTKFQPDRRDPLRESARSIEQLGVDYVDLYLVHWPRGGATWAWPGMEAARARSYARAIGVSNFDAGELDQVIADASAAPVVDHRDRRGRGGDPRRRRQRDRAPWSAWLPGRAEPALRPDRLRRAVAPHVSSASRSVPSISGCV